MMRLRNSMTDDSIGTVHMRGGHGGNTTGVGSVNQLLFTQNLVL
jgi:hypothetical protein